MYFYHYDAWMQRQCILLFFLMGILLFFKERIHSLKKNWFQFFISDFNISFQGNTRLRNGCCQLSRTACDRYPLVMTRALYVSNCTPLWLTHQSLIHPSCFPFGVDSLPLYNVLCRRVNRGIRSFLHASLLTLIMPFSLDNYIFFILASKYDLHIDHISLERLFSMCEHPCKDMMISGPNPAA